MAGGIGLYALVADGEAGAEVYAAATTKEQAKILFRDAVRMVRKSAPLKNHLDIVGGEINPGGIHHTSTDSKFIPLSKEAANSGSGMRPYFVFADEIHEFKDRTVLDILEAGFKFRRNPMIIMITNSGIDIQTSVCGEEHLASAAVVEGKIKDDRHFSYICALDKKDDPYKNPDCWIKANPTMGTIITPEYLAERIQRAQNNPSRANHIMRLHFCVWTSGSDSPWITREAWQKIEDKKLQIDEYAGKRCWIGLDLSGTTDLTAMAVVYDDGVTKEGKPKFVAEMLCWTPKDTLSKRVKEEKVPYDLWVKQGFIRAEAGALIRLDFIAKELIDIKNRTKIQTVAYDEYLYKDLKSHIDEYGERIPTTVHGQGYQKRRESNLWMPQSIIELEGLIYEKRIRILPSPLMAMAVSGAAMDESAAGLRRWTKKKSSVRIDPIVALCMAVGAATALPGDTNLTDFYEQNPDEKHTFSV